MGGQAVKAIPDTNLLVRMAIRDDPVQERKATAALSKADSIAISLPTLCEFCWVLSRGYRKTAAQVAVAVRALTAVKGVQADLPAVEAGLVFLDEGGDFADGVIAYEGRRLGGETFITFDRQAATLTKRQGNLATLLS